MDEVEKTLDSSVEATPETTTETSPAPEGGNEENHEIQEPQKDYKAEYEKLSERYSNSSREANKFKEQAEQTQAELMQTVTKTRETFESYVDEKGLSPDQKEYYMNLYDTQIAPQRLTQAPSKGTENTTVNPSPSVSIPQEARIDPVRQAWMNRMDATERARLEAQTEATTEFFEDPVNKELPMTVQESIRATAAMLDREYGYKPAEALQVAKKRILEPEAIKNEGYTEGVRDSMTGGISRGVVGSGGNQKDRTRLPAKDEAFVQLEIQRKGLKGESAERFRQTYAERLARRS